MSAPPRWPAWPSGPPTPPFRPRNEASADIGAAAHIRRRAVVKTPQSDCELPIENVAGTPMTRSNVAWLAGAAMLVLAAPSFAADLPLAARIDAVTVYPDGAVVTRLVEIAIPAGAHQGLLQGLPQAVDPASIRVEGVADQAIVIGPAE